MNQNIDASKITAITLEGACPDCYGSGEQIWCKAKADPSGNAYIYHNKCGWAKTTNDKWSDYVAKRIAEGYIYYTDETNLIAPWYIRPGMEKVLYRLNKSGKKTAGGGNVIGAMIGGVIGFFGALFVGFIPGVILSILGETIHSSIPGAIFGVWVIGCTIFCGYMGSKY